MYKMTKDDFVFEVKEELCCYEEIGDKGAQRWEQGFEKWLSEHPMTSFRLDDESDVFEIADEYVEAVETKNEINYWKNFKI